MRNLQVVHVFPLMFKHIDDGVKDTIGEPSLNVPSHEYNKGN